MDALDFRLLSELYRDARASYGDLGSKVALTGNAVKSRIQRLLQEGVLQGFAPRPPTKLLGLRDGLLVFSPVDDVDEREEDLLHALTDVPGVRVAEAGLDRTLHVWVVFADEADWDRIERAAISLVGKPPAWRAACDGDDSAAADAYSPADWRVVRALLADGRAPVKDLAQGASLSHKPLKKRLDALLRDGRVHIEPVLSPSEAQGLILFRLLLHLKEATAMADVLRALPKDVIATVEADGILSVYLQAPSLRDARATLAAAKQAPGVERAHLQVATRRVASTWLEEHIAKRLEKPAPAQPAAQQAPVPQAPAHQPTAQQVPVPRPRR